jgi:ACS family D-galactonate transporter-like MFS transporter
MQIPSGWLADRLKPRALTTGSTVGWGVVEALTAVASSTGVLLVLRLLLGVFEGPIYPAGAKLNAVWLTQEERGRGGTIIDAGAPLGTAIGGVVIVGLIGWLGSWQAAFIASGVITVILGLMAAWMIRNTPEEHPFPNAAEREYLRKAHEEEDRPVALIPARKNLLKYLPHLSFWTMCLGWLGFDVVFYGLLSWVPFYLTKFRHVPFAVSGVSVFIIFGLGFVGELVGGQLADYWRRKGGRPNTVMRTLLGIAAAITTIAVFLVAYATTAAEAIGLLAIVLFFLRWAGLYWSVPSILTDQSNAGLLGGAMNFVGNIGGIIAPIAVGAILGATHSFFLALMMFAFSGFLWFICSVLMDYSRKLPISA